MPASRATALPCLVRSGGERAPDVWKPELRSGCPRRDRRPSRRDRHDRCRRGRGLCAKRLGFATRIVALGSDLAELERLRSLHPLAVFNLVDAVNGDGRLAPSVSARLDALGLRYTGCGTSASLETLSKIGTKLKLAQAGLPTPSW